MSQLRPDPDRLGAREADDACSPDPPRSTSQRVRGDFPILSTKAHGKPLVYLDNGATTQKPRQVIDAIGRYYEIAERQHPPRRLRASARLATDAVRAGPPRRCSVHQRRATTREIIFTRGTTEAINLVARPGPDVPQARRRGVVSAMEHHSNIVPWQMACEATGATLRVIPMNDAGELRDGRVRAGCSAPRTKLVAVNHVSNSLGTINPVEARSPRWPTQRREGAGRRRAVGGPPRRPTCSDSTCDFYAFSGHKLSARRASACCTASASCWSDAAVPGRRGHDRVGDVREDRLRRAAEQVRGRHAGHRRARSAWRRRSITCSRSGSKRSRRTRTSCSRYATEQLSDSPGPAHHRHGQAQGRRDLVRDGGPADLVAGHRHRSWTRRRRRPHRAPLLPAGDGPLRHPARRRGRRWRCTTRGRTSTRWSPRCRRCREHARKAAAHRRQSRIGHGDGSVAQRRRDRCIRKSAAASPHAAADELAEVFEMLGDRDARNRVRAGAGRRLPHTFDVLKTGDRARARLHERGLPRRPASAGHVATRSSSSPTPTPTSSAG